jgi:enoyl-CoA hydratase
MKAQIRFREKALPLNYSKEIKKRSMKYILFEKKDEIGILTFNNPERLNVLSTACLKELQQCLIDLSSDTVLKALILKGKGKAFAAGADLRELQCMSPQQAKAFSRLGNAICKLIQDFPVPVIAAVNGYALGGGLELVLSADFAYASRWAKFGLPELSLGLTPGFGGTKRLSERIGMALAKELIFTARSLKADEALRLHLVNKVVDPEELLESAFATAQEIGHVSPYAVREAKALLNACSDTPLDSTIEVETDKFGLLFAHGDAQEGMTAFLEKRAPAWRKIDS